MTCPRLRNRFALALTAVSRIGSRIVFRLVFGIALFSACWTSRPTAAQSDPPSATLRQLLKHLAAIADALDRSLPSIICQESAVSERLDRGKVKQHVAFTANLRARRSAAEDHIAESYELTTVNGKPASSAGRAIPFYVSGGFDRALVYFTPRQQACYRFTLAPNRIDFATAPDLAAHPQCRDDQLHGFALLDAAGNVTHLERTVGEAATRELHLVPFAATDFASVDLNGQTFLLSSHLHAELPDGHAMGRFDVTYTGYRLFAVTVTIEPPTAISPAGVPQAEPNKGPQ